MPLMKMCKSTSIQGKYKNARSTFRSDSCTSVHTYIQKFIYTRWPQQLRADFHEGRDFRKNILYR
jgi:hypothetical protein